MLFSKIEKMREMGLVEKQYGKNKKGKKTEVAHSGRGN